ncbi:MAG: homocysteine S-methyltransferase family protein [Nanobdellota archaeon]
MRNILKKRLNSHSIICAEGYLFEMERRGYMKAGPFVPEVVLDNPEALKQLHREFLRAGSDVVEAFTYYAHRDKMRTVGRERDLEYLNRQALRLAKSVADEKDALMAGNICNTWIYNPDDKETWKQVYDMFDEQVRWAKEEGADYIIGETFFYHGEAVIALEVIRKYGLESVITFAPFHSKTLDGYNYEDACNILEEFGATVVGMNCGAGPATMFPIIKKIRKKVCGPVACLPVPYRTTVEAPRFQKLVTRDGKQAFPVLLEEFLLNREEIAAFAREAKKIGVEYIGLCCGGAPHYIRAIAEELGRTPEASKYSPNIKGHAMLGSDVKTYNKKNIEDWRP